jgi:hypothetical protein
MKRDSYDTQLPLIECAEYDILRSDLVFLKGQVEQDIRKFSSQARPLNADWSSVGSLLSTDWMFAIVSMPGWVGHALCAPDQVRRRALVGSYYIYHHVLALDRMIDADRARASANLPHSADVPSSTDRTRSVVRDIAAALPLVTSLTLRQFQHIFESNSPFWDDYDRAFTIWADAMHWERHIKSYRDISLEDGMRMESGKCAPAYISAAAVCRASGHQDRMAEVEHTIMLTNMAMDLVDDNSDWMTDLTEGRFNSFVALAAGHDLVEADIPTVDDMLAAILNTPLLDLYVDQVCALTARIERAATTIGVEFWLPLLKDLRRSATKQRDAFRTGLVSISNSLFQEGS